MNNAELVGNPRMKKRSNFETEDQKKERVKKEERMFWEKMTSVLDDKKLSTWKALDKALTKYYALLVDRQNLIEETGLLNQQNEELKTLLIITKAYFNNITYIEHPQLLLGGR